MPRLLSAFTLLLISAVPCLADEVKKAEPQPATQPTLVVRLQSIDGIISDLKYLAEAVGHGEQAKQADELFKSQIGEKGLEGIDTKKPLGLYGVLKPDFQNSTAVALIPVANEKAVLELLEQVNVKVEKGKDGIYSASVENARVPIYFRFANKEYWCSASSVRVCAVMSAALHRIGSVSSARTRPTPRALRSMSVAQKPRLAKSSPRTTAAPPC